MWHIFSHHDAAVSKNSAEHIALFPGPYTERCSISFPYHAANRLPPEVCLCEKRQSDWSSEVQIILIWVDAVLGDFPYLSNVASFPDAAADFVHKDDILVRMLNHCFADLSILV